MTEKTDKDRLYAGYRDVVDDFVFDDQVAEVFPDMIRRSVPGYATIINMIGTLAAQSVVDGSCCYDLGCSLGAAAMAIERGKGARECRIIAVDNSPAMISRAQQHQRQSEIPSSIEFVCGDLMECEIANASMVVLNFTLQFVPLERRDQLMARISQGMLPGGVLVLSEKIALPDEETQQRFTEMHHSFKMAQGYSELEISQKRTALEKVLLPETLEAHRRRLASVGFKSVKVWFQCFNFVSLLAIK